MTIAREKYCYRVIEAAQDPDAELTDEQRKEVIRALSALTGYEIDYLESIWNETVDSWGDEADFANFVGITMEMDW